MSFNIKQNDRAPSISCALEAPAGVPVDLTGTTVNFVMRAEGGVSPKVNALATIDNATAGLVHYDWGSTDTDTAGLYAAEWEVSFVGGIVRTFPADGYLYINVEASLAA